MSSQTNAVMQPDDVFTLTHVHQNSVFSSSDHIVLLTFDDNYLDQSINLILSIARHNPRGVSFICICPQLKEESIGALLALVQGIQVRCYRFSLDFQMGRWALSAVLRLFCPWLLDANIHKVLYMDSDILCTGSLEDIFALEFPYIAMCSEIKGNVSATRQKTIRPYCPTEIYCNSGVTAFNLDSLRADYSFGEIFEALSAVNGKVIYLDQDFLNIHFRGKIHVLNPFHYNFQAYELKGTPFYREAMENCRLIHFSVGKPWKYKTHLYLIRLYLKHSAYEPMIRKVKKTYVQSLLYSPIRFVRHLLSPIKQAVMQANTAK